MLFSNGNLNYSHQSGMFGLEIGSAAGSVIGLAVGLSEGYKPRELEDNYRHLQTNSINVELKKPDVVPIKATKFHVRSELGFNGHILSWNDYYSDGSIVNSGNWSANSGPWGNGRLPSGEYLADNLRIRDDFKNGGR